MSAIQPAIEPAGAHQHQVQLYGCDETFLIKNVSRYICEGLSRGEGVLVLGTPEHVDGFMRGLSALGVDVEAAIERKQLAFPDAAETLDSFLIDGQPDGDRFEYVISQAIRKLQPPAGTIRAYGEMVGLLWSAGRFEEAVRLEELWNRALPVLGLQLYCAYPIDIFKMDVNAPSVRALLDAHTHVLPSGEYGDLDRALSRALNDAAESDGIAGDMASWTFAPLRSAAIPRAETAIFSLKSEASEAAERILSRARHYYRTEKRFRALIENSSDGIALLDVHGEIRYASSSAARLLGYAPEDVVGMSSLALTHPEEAGSVRESFKNVRETPRIPVRFEARLRRSDGRWIWLDNTINNLLDEPEVNGIVWNYRDISERKASEDALRHANEGLEQFAYAAAHNLQEPIRNIALYSELVAKRYEDKLDEEARKFIGITIDGARRMQTLIRDLLAYTHSLNAPGEEVKMTDSARVMEGVLANLRTTIEETGASVICGPLPKLPIYRAHLVQLFQNLIGNALKYRGTQAPFVEVSCEESAEQFSIAIRDNGIGIAPDHRERIFGVFKRLHGRNIPGNGMGLAICNRIVLHYRGRMWVESEPGKGSKFVFTLPRHPHPERG